MGAGSQAVYLFLITIPNIVLGLFILLRNPKDNINRHFAAFAFGVGLWALGLGLYLRTDSLVVAQYWAQLYYVAAASIATSFMFFSSYFSSRGSKIQGRTYLLLCIPLGILTVATVIYPGWLITDVVQRDWGKEVLLNRPGYVIYSLYFTSYVLIGFVTMLKNTLKARGLYRTYLQFVFIGLIVAFSLGMIFNLVYPAFGNYRHIWVGPQFTLFYVAVIAYAITKHKLFDVRAAVVRSVSYVLAAAFAITVYAVLLFGVGSLLVQLDTISFTQWSIIGILAIILAVTYAPIFRLFDRLTNKFFYKDAYNSQDVLKQVSDIIVGTIDSHRVQKGTLSVLSEALKPTHMAFLFTSSNGGIRKGDAIGQQWAAHNPEKLNTTLERIGKKIIVIDELEDRRKKHGEVLRESDISIVSPLVTKDETIGYLVLGAKKSGNIYNSQDVGLLNIATNELAVALQNAQRFEEIQAFNITLQEKVTEATRELKKTNKKLVALDEAKDEFISMASHQLRTPLTSIKGYLSMLLEGDLGKVSTTQEKALQDAFGSSQRMVYLIADFLNVSRIKTGKFVIDPSEVELPQIVNEEISQLREMAAAKDLKLTYEQPGIFPTVRLDENKIRQVMMNMVDNAIYYTPSGGKITIQLYVTGEELLFKVVDTGIGVPKREQHKMFTKFFRADNAKKARPDGTGLGLFMAQKIVVAQGGAVIFESVEGKGSTFGFRFPLAKIKSS